MTAPLVRVNLIALPCDSTAALHMQLAACPVLAGLHGFGMHM